MHGPQASTESHDAPPRPRGRRWRIRIASRRAMIRLACLGTALLGAGVIGWALLINMPGRPHTGPLPALTERQARTAQQLEADVRALASDTPRRHTFVPAEYAAAADYLASRLESIGLTPQREVFNIPRGMSCQNVYADLAGTDLAGEIVVIGAHYDSYADTPGADDNASGVAGVLALAERFASRSPRRTIRFILFANEEPPHFMTAEMGSHVHAFAAKDRQEPIHAMVSIEMIGYYNERRGSQHYPAPLSSFYPDTADFIAVVGNLGATPLVRRSVDVWRRTTPFPCYGAALPEGIPGVGFSDHWSFWQAGHPAMMVTDTAFFRNPHYHSPTDTPDTLDYERMSRVVDGIEQVVIDLADRD